jgi:hypothetical protein
MDMASSTAVVLVKFAGALAVGAVVHRYFERPMMASARTPRDPGVTADPGVTVLGLGPGGWTGVLGVGALLATLLVPTSAATIDFGAAQDRFEEQVAQQATTGPVSEHTPTRILMFGASSALMDGLGGMAWGALDQAQRPHFGGGYTELGCGLMVQSRVDIDEVTPTPDESNVVTVAESCRSWPSHWSEAIAAERSGFPDSPLVAILVASHWDLRDRVDPATGERYRPGDERYAAELIDELRRAVDILVDGGADRVVVTLLDRADPRWPAERQAEVERRRKVYAGVVEEVLAEERATRGLDQNELLAVEPELWTDGLSEAEVVALSPDGVHHTEAGAVRMWEEWLWPQLEAIGVEPTA